MRWIKAYAYWIQFCGVAIAAIVSLVAIVAAIYTYSEQSKIWVEEREDRLSARKVAVWHVLTVRASGNSGKVAALQYLHSVGESLRGIDLSCEAHSGGWDAEKRTCERRVYLQSLTLPGADLKRANLSGADLEWANLSDADLQLANLPGADLQWAKLSDADLQRANLSGANLRSARLNGANLWKASLSDADLSGADLRGANLQWANLSDADLRGADLSGADLQWANLSDADLRGADLGGANLRRADLSGALLQSASLHNADLTGAEVSGVQASQVWGYIRALHTGSLPPFACEGNTPSDWPDEILVVIVGSGQSLFAAYETSFADKRLLLKQIREEATKIGLKKREGDKKVDIFPCK